MSADIVVIGASGELADELRARGFTVDEGWQPVPAPEGVEVIGHNEVTGAMGFTLAWIPDPRNGRVMWQGWPAPNKPTHWRHKPTPRPPAPDPRADLGSIIYQGQL